MVDINFGIRYSLRTHTQAKGVRNNYYPLKAAEMAVAMATLV